MSSASRGCPRPSSFDSNGRKLCELELPTFPMHTWTAGLPVATVRRGTHGVRIWPYRWSQPRDVCSCPQETRDGSVCQSARASTCGPSVSGRTTGKKDPGARRGLPRPAAASVLALQARKEWPLLTFLADSRLIVSGDDPTTVAIVLSE